MKKVIFCLLIFLLGAVQISRVGVKNKAIEVGVEVPNETPAPSFQVTTIEKSMPVLLAVSEPVPTTYILEESVVVEEITEIETVEERSFNDEVPLGCEEQQLLQDACTEFEVPYALALGLIETETNFRNISGDGGASSGYMQIQQRWHQDRMDRLGVSDLDDPEGNFRVGLDFLSELYEDYGTWEMALTVYNRGHNPGFITDYAYKVMNHYEKWTAIVGTDE